LGGWDILGCKSDICKGITTKIRREVLGTLVNKRKRGRKRKRRGVGWVKREFELNAYNPFLLPS